MNTIISSTKTQIIFDEVFSNLRIRPVFSFTLFLIYSFLFRIPYLPISILKYISFVFVIALVFYTINIFRNYRYFIKTPYFIFLFIFLISNLLSFFLFEKGKISFLTSDALNHIVLLIILFPTQVNLTKENNLKNYEFFLKLVLIWNLGMILISEFMLFMNYSGVTCTGYDCHYTGINGTRLYGIYTDPNYASMLALITILISIFFFIKSEKLFYKIIYILIILLSYIFIVFTYSRTGLISLLIAIFIFSFYYLNKFLSKNIFLSLIISSILLLIIAFLPTPLRSFYNHIFPTKIERNSYVENIDISNNRFDIWSSGVIAISDHPILGIGYRNIKSYFNGNYPGTYIANHDKAYELHNVVLNILISQGIIGLIPFSIFSFLIIKLIWKTKNQTYSDQKYLIILLLISIIISISCESMFISDILYLYTPTSILFWISLGSLVKTIPSIESN